MKLTYFQLEPHLSKKLSSIYIVSGDDILLKQDACSLIRKAAQTAGFTERTRFTPEPGFDWEQLYSLLHANSLFAEKQLLELDFRDTLPPKAASSILQEYAKNPSPNNLLLIDISKIDDKIAKSAWYNAVEKTGMAITIWPIAKEQLPNWIIQRAKRYKLTLTNDAANLLADYVEGNLIAAAQAIEKLYLLKPAEAIDFDLINAVITNESHFTIFDFIDSLITGNQARTLNILESLKLDGVEPILVLWGITRELRSMADMATQLKHGRMMDEVLQKHRVFTRRQPLVKRFLAKVSAQDCWHHLMHAADIDKIIKGAAPGDAWESLQLFCLRVA